MADQFRKEGMSVSIAVSSAEQTLGGAKSVLELAKRHEQDGRTLPACVVVVAAAALEQASRTVLSARARSPSEEEWIKKEANRLLPKQDNGPSLCYRFQELPKCVSGGQFELNREGIRDLKELIDLRNELAHIKEEAVLLQGQAQQVKWEGDDLVVRIPMPANPWTETTVDTATHFLEFAETYFREALFPTDGRLTAGRLLRWVN